MEQHDAIYDARLLGRPHMMILGVQHLFAMFGATVLVPLLAGLDVSVTLLFAGIVGIFLNAVMPDKLGMKVKEMHSHLCTKN